MSTLQEPQAQAGSETSEVGEKPNHGFTTYLNYLESIVEKWPEYGRLWERLREKKPYPWQSWTRVTICDILTDGRIIQERYFDRDREFVNLHAVLLKAASTVRTRYIFIDCAPNLPPEMIECLGLALDIEPRFFSSVIDQDLRYLPQPANFIRIWNTHVKLFPDILLQSTRLSICEHHAHHYKT